MRPAPQRDRFIRSDADIGPVPARHEDIAPSLRRSRQTRKSPRGATRAL
jgi:hypothetical protein